MNHDNEIKKALKICGGNYTGVAFKNMFSIYKTCLRELPCPIHHLKLELQSDIGITERKADEKIAVLFHRNILKTGKDDMVFWYTDNNGNAKER